MKKILTPVDFSDITERIMELTEKMASAMGCEVFLLHVAAPDPDFVGYDAGPQTVRDQVAVNLHQEHQQLDVLDNRLEKKGITSTAICIQGPTADKILQEVERLDIDLIIMGSHGHGAIYELLAGSVTESVLRNAPCPVLFVPAHDKRKAIS